MFSLTGFLSAEDSTQQVSFLSQGIHIHLFPSFFIIVVLSVLEHDVPHDSNKTVLTNNVIHHHSLTEL